MENYFTKDTEIKVLFKKLISGAESATQRFCYQRSQPDPVKR